MKTRLLVLSFPTLLALLSLSRAASACGFAITLETAHELEVAQSARENQTQALMLAEESLERGAFTTSALAVLRAYPGLGQQNPGRASPLTGRALRTMALSAVRLDGALPPSNSWLYDQSRERNLLWAIEALRAMHDREPASAGLLTDLGEALVSTARTEDEGREILEQLAREDLMVDAEGYAALAREREASGDTAGRQQALDRCLSMTLRPEVCAPEQRWPKSRG